MNPNFTSTLLIFFISLLFSCSHEKEIAQASPGPPNIILIFMDDMGYGDLACYGHPLIKTPNLNELADGGIRFTSFYAPSSVCTPSRAGLLTGRYSVRNAPYNFGPESTNGLPLSEKTIADILKGAGYQTGAIGKWHLGHLPEYLPTSRGFDSFYGLPYSNDMILPWCPWLSEEDRLFLYQDTTKAQEIGREQDNLTLNYTNQAISFIQNHKESPFFLYLAHSMPHLPISVSEDFKGKSAAGLYGDVVEMVDWSVGEIVKTLQKEGLEENTLIIFTSDNGPWHNLPDRMVQGGVERWHTGSKGNLRGAKGTTYEGGFRVPGIMYWPNEISANQINRELVTALDIFPTLVDVSGATMPADLRIDGTSLLPLLKGQEASPRHTFFYANLKTIEAVRQDEWKLRYTKKAGTELYNLQEDPGERYNRAEEFPEKVESLSQAIKTFAKETDAKTHFE